MESWLINEKVQSRRKSKIVLEVLREENTLVEISNKYEVSSNADGNGFSGQHAVSI